MYPIKMKPALKDYIWGGNRLRDAYGKRAEMNVIAESWEVSCHPDGPSAALGGPCDGRTLPDLLAEHPEWLGSRCAGHGEFPLLVKLIDAEQSLSLQVHPDDEYARLTEGQQGKNEMWYVVDAAPGTELVLGFERPVGRDELRRRIADGTIMEVARRVPVKAGDCYLVPAGLMHAIGAGSLIAEIQQNSNVTYRVFDFGRVGADGKPRELHVEKALDVIDSTVCAQNGSGGAVLADWPFFHAELLRVTGSGSVNCGPESFTCLLVTAGNGTLRHGEHEIDLCAGESAFLPAGLGTCAVAGDFTALLARV